MNEIKLYENKEIRSVWDEEKEEWYFSVVDVVAVLTESKDPQVYWRVLKNTILLFLRPKRSVSLYFHIVLFRPL